MKQITIKTKNEPGSLSNICDALEKAGVNIVSLFGEGLNSEGLVHIITEDEETARKALDKSGHPSSTSDVLSVKVTDRPGELAKIIRKLAFAKVNIETISLLTRERGEATVVIKTNSVKKAKEALV